MVVTRSSGREKGDRPDDTEDDDHDSMDEDSPDPTVLPAPHPPRQKLYPAGSVGPWVVFIRPKENQLKVLQISRDLGNRFKFVTAIHKVRPDKLWVVVESLKEANQIAACKKLTEEYRV